MLSRLRRFRWWIALAVVVLVAGVAIGVYWASTAADRACEDFTKTAQQYVAENVDRKDMRSVGVEVLFRGGEFEYQGKVFRRPPGCQAPPFP